MKPQPHAPHSMLARPLPRTRTWRSRARRPLSLPRLSPRTCPSKTCPDPSLSLPFMHWEGRLWYNFYSLGQPLPHAKEIDWDTFWLTFESEPASGPGGPAAVPTPEQPKPAPPSGQAEPPQPASKPTLSETPKPKADPPQLGPTLSRLDVENYRIERDARGRILIHQCDYDVLMAHSVRGLASARFMMDNESFTVVSGPYPFDDPPTVPPPAREPTPAQTPAEEPTPAQQAPTPTASETTAGPKEEADTDLLGLNSEEGDANRPRGSSFPDPSRTDRSYKPKAQGDRLQPTPRLLIGQPPDRRYRGCTILPSMCLPDTFRLAQHDAQVCYVDHNSRLRCARPCNTPPFCPYGLVCAQQMNSPDEAHERHQCSRCHEFDKHRESVWGHFLSPTGP